jgi:RNA polymerase-binding transcription factor DksA
MAKRKKTEDTEEKDVKKTAKKTTAKKTAAKKTSKSSTTKKKTAKSETAKKAAEKKETKPVAKKTEPVEAKKVDAPKEPTVQYSDADLKDFEDNIVNSKNEALDELRMLKERLEDLTSPDMADESMVYSMHMAEQGSEAMEKEKTYAQIQRINEYLKKLDDALQRIKDKTYGICRVCGCLINKQRLLAVPITTLSASYKIHQKCPEDGIDKIEPLKED